ncbi:AhpC/TSA antioxidant enzyme [Aureococcus anophagefferens]|nr:AhpC/TSA antioxidant enzyme [Aureococcus anophagefferens]
MVAALSCLVAAVLVGNGAFGLQRLSGITASKLVGGAPVDLGAALAGDKKTCVVLGTYAADFNAIEYCQRLQHYAPKLRERGYDDFKIILCDPSGAAGRAFGVSRGWKPDDDEIRITDEFAIPLNAYGKLFGMLLGLGAWATLPAVIGGYIGNPFTPQPWIEDALAQGMRKDRFPGNALDLDASGAVTSNKFKELPGVGSWPRPPLELATLRLQNMVGISLAKWDELKPDNLATLTQLGGCVLSDGNGGVAYEWTDPGICAVANFEEILTALDAPAKDDAAVEALAV